MTNYLQREALYSSQSPRHCSPRMIRQTIPTKDIIPVEVDSVFLSLRLKPSPQKKSIYKGNGFAPRIYYSPQKYDPEGWEDDGWTLSNDLHHLDEDVFYTPTTLKSYRNRGKSSRPHKRG